MSKLILKASEISNLTDARYFSAWAVDWLGFSLDSSSAAYISPTQIAAMREWLSGPGIVAEMGAYSDKETLLEAIEILKPDAIQIGQFTELEAIKNIAGTTIIRELIPDSMEQLEEMLYEWREWNDYVSFFLLNLEKNGFSWQTIKSNDAILRFLINLCSEYRVVLSLSFSADELSEIIQCVNPHGFSLKGGEEEKTGMKSFDELDSFFEKLEEINEDC
jgi:phosphoribosylanthranilate isomerase